FTSYSSVGSSAFQSCAPSGVHYLRWLPSILVRARRYLLHHVVDGKARRLGPGRKLPEAVDISRNERLRRYLQEYPASHPVAVEHAGRTALEWIGAQIVHHWRAQPGETALPYAEGSFWIHLGMLLHEGQLPAVDSQCEQVAVIAPVEEFLA